MEIYIHRDGQQFGPYSTEQAREYVADGRLHADDLAWHEGAAEWMPIGQLPAMTPAAPSAPEPEWVPPRRTDVSSSFVPGPVKSTADKAFSVPDKIFATGPVPTPQAAPAKIADATVPANFKSAPPRKTSYPVDGFTKAQRSIGLRNMGVGGAFFIGGIAVTYFSYEAAASTPGGGTYFMTWGAVLFGGIQFVRGLILFCKA